MCNLDANLGVAMEKPDSILKSMSFHYLQTSIGELIETKKPAHKSNRTLGIQILLYILTS